MNNENRKGRATSSQFYRIVEGVTKPTKPFYSYVNEVVAERLLDRSHTVEAKTSPMSWGSLMEIIVTEHIVEEHTASHKDTLLHPIFGEYWSGTPDIIFKDRIGEIKCPQPKAFAQISIAMFKKDVSYIKKNYKEYYWQCVSNAMIAEKEKAELIIFMPYKTELKRIIELCRDTDYLEDNDLDPKDYYFLQDGIEKLAYLPDTSKLSNFNSLTFDIPEEDKQLAKSRISLFASEVDAELKNIKESAPNVF